MTKPPRGRQRAIAGSGRAAALAVLLAAGGCALAPRGSAGDEAAIRAVLARQVADWNSGDIESFMRGYLQDDSTRFASGDSAGRGWDAALARYRARYPDASAMGRLAFGEIEVEALDHGTALAFGRWRMDGAEGTQHGLFTLVLVRTVDGWKIVHDHTSAGAPRAGTGTARPAGSQTGGGSVGRPGDPGARPSGGKRMEETVHGQP